MKVKLEPVESRRKELLKDLNFQMVVSEDLLKVAGWEVFDL